LSRQQGGTFHSLNPNDDIEQAVTALGQTLGQPVLLNLKLSDGWEPADAAIPNLYAGQIHYLSARSSNGSRKPLELTARTPSMKPVKIQFEQQSAESDAPYLHWCKSRIVRLIAEGKSKTAVALSTQSNLICPLTAFIAWDEAEKVVVATHELVQPSLLLQECCSPVGMVAGASEASTVLYDCLPDQAASMNLFIKTRDPAAGGALRRLGRGIARMANSAGRSDPSPEVADELALKRELSDICHQNSVPDWEALVKAIFDWVAEARSDERKRRIAAVNKLLQEIRALAGPIADVAKSVHRLLNSFGEKLPARKVL